MDEFVKIMIFIVTSTEIFIFNNYRQMFTKFIVITIMATMLVFPAVAQQRSNAAQIDSLVAVLPQLRDSVKLKAMSTLIELTRDELIRKSYVNMYLDEARRQKDTYSEGRALALLAEIYFAQFDTDSIFIFAEEAYAEAKETQQKMPMAEMLAIMGRLYDEMGQQEEAIRCYEESIEMTLQVRRLGIMNLENYNYLDRKSVV